MTTLKSLPAHSVNALIIPIPRDCVHYYYPLDETSISEGSFVRAKHLCVLIHIRKNGEVGTVKQV